MYLVARLQPHSARVPMHFLAHAVAHDPDAALARLPPRLPAVVKNTALAVDAIVANVGMLALYRAVDLRVLGERQIVAAEQPLVAVHIYYPADIDARLVNSHALHVSVAFPHHQLGHRPRFPIRPRLHDRFHHQPRFAARPQSPVPGIAGRNRPRRRRAGSPPDRADGPAEDHTERPCARPTGSSFPAPG